MKMQDRTQRRDRLDARLKTVFASLRTVTLKLSPKVRLKLATRVAPKGNLAVTLGVFLGVTLGVILGAGLTSPSLGQTTAPALPDAPFLKDLERLAEILGSVHYLEAMCHGDGVSPWRGRMQALMETEFRSEELKKRAIARFNLGYQSYANIHTTCSDAAQVTLDRFLDEGTDIADDVVKRYGR